MKYNVYSGFTKLENAKIYDTVLRESGAKTESFFFSNEDYAELTKKDYYENDNDRSTVVDGIIKVTNPNQVLSKLDDIKLNDLQEEDRKGIKTKDFMKIKEDIKSDISSPLFSKEIKPEITGVGIER